MGIEALGVGRAKGNYAYDIYEVEFVPEVLFGAKYRKSLTTIYPRFLTAMAKYHDEEIRLFLSDAFCFTGEVCESEQRFVELFTSLDVDMYFEGEATLEAIGRINIETALSAEEVLEIVKKCIR